MTFVETESLQPTPLVTIYLIATIPAVTPATTPLLFTVAIVVFALAQVPPMVELLNVVVAPTHKLVVPVIELIEGNAFIVIILETVESQPFEFVIL
ncbi:hypothetical protein EBX93_15140 [bacterium]|nr:hypothetical protein [bacterium]